MWHTATLVPDCALRLHPIPFCSVLAPGTCFCPGSAQGRHLMGFMRIDRPFYGKRGRATGPGWRPDLIHRPGVGTLLREGWCPLPARISVVSPSSGRGAGRIEGGAVDPHAMQNDGELAGERDLGLLHAGALGDSHAPA